MKGGKKCRKTNFPKRRKKNLQTRRKHKEEGRGNLYTLAAKSAADFVLVGYVLANFVTFVLLTAFTERR